MDYEFTKKQILAKEIIRAGDGCKYRVLHTGSNWCVVRLLAGARDKDVFRGKFSSCINYLQGL